MPGRSPGPDIEVQVAEEVTDTPGEALFERWAMLALQGRQDVALTIRIVGEEEGRELNRRYRGGETATNVLSFPADLPDCVDEPLLGDIVICSDVVVREAASQGKPPRDHWAHLTIHGVLHLLGYDHLDEEEAASMERLETRLLEDLGIDDPYRARG